MNRGAGPIVLLVLAFAGSLAVSNASAATIAGKVFTAESVDSLAQGASVTLVIHAGPGTDTKQVETSTDAQGHFHFPGLPSDTSLAYVLRITFRGKDFLSNPIRFPAGEEQIDYNVLLSDHSPESGQPEPVIQGRPARQSVFHTILIVLCVVVLFSLFATLARRQDSAEESRGAQPPEVGALIREIASLDVRHEDGIIGDDEYRKVRSALLARLRSLSRKPSGSAA